MLPGRLAGTGSAAVALAWLRAAGSWLVGCRHLAPAPAIGAAARGADRPLAVLPFQALGVAGDSGVLTIGIPDAIITRLAGVHQLRLRPTTAVLRYEAPTLDPQAAGPGARRGLRAHRHRAVRCRTARG